MNSDEYAYLHKCGADYVTVFQETYHADKYETLHLAGHKGFTLTVSMPRKEPLWVAAGSSFRCPSGAGRF